MMCPRLHHGVQRSTMARGEEVMTCANHAQPGRRRRGAAAARPDTPEGALEESGERRAPGGAPATPGAAGRPEGLSHPALEPRPLPDREHR